MRNRRLVANESASDSLPVVAAGVPTPEPTYIPIIDTLQPNQGEKCYNENGGYGTYVLVYDTLTIPN